LEGKIIDEGKMLKGVGRKSAPRTFNIGLRKLSQRKNFNIGFKAKEKPKRTWDSAQCRSKDPDFKSYACAGCRPGCLQV
jgi:hypothetical protein